MSVPAGSVSSVPLPFKYSLVDNLSTPTRSPECSCITSINVFTFGATTSGFASPITKIMRFSSDIKLTWKTKNTHFETVTSDNNKHWFYSNICLMPVLTTSGISAVLYSLVEFGLSRACTVSLNGTLAAATSSKAILVLIRPELESIAKYLSSPSKLYFNLPNLPLSLSSAWT